MPGRGADPIRSTRSGVVAAVRITEGQAIVHGTPAFVIRSAAAGDRSAEMRSLETQMSGAEESRLNTKQRFESQRRRRPGGGAPAERARRQSPRQARRAARAARRARGALQARSRDPGQRHRDHRARDRLQEDPVRRGQGAGRPAGALLQGRLDLLARVQQPQARGHQARGGAPAARAHAREQQAQAEPDALRAPDVGDRLEAQRGRDAGGAERDAGRRWPGFVRPVAPGTPRNGRRSAGSRRTQPGRASGRRPCGTSSTARAAPS